MPGRSAVQKKLDRLTDRDEGWRYLTELAGTRSRPLHRLALMKLDEWITCFGRPPAELVDFIKRVLFHPVHDYAKWASAPARQLGEWTKRVAQLDAQVRRNVGDCFKWLGKTMRQQATMRKARARS